MLKNIANTKIRITVKSAILIAISYAFKIIKLLCTCAYVERKFVNVDTMHQNLTGRKINEKLQSLGKLSGIIPVITNANTRCCSWTNDLSGQKGVVRLYTLALVKCD